MAQPSFPVAGRRLTKRHSAPANNVLSCAAGGRHCCHSRREARGMSSLFRLLWLCHGMWLFHLHSTLKIQLFIRFSPWRNPQLKYFVSYPFGISKEKASAVFYGTAIAFQGPEGDKRRRARRKPENMAKSILIPLPKKRSYARKTSAPLSGACLPFSITHYPPYINQRLMRLCRICRPAVRQGS